MGSGNSKDAGSCKYVPARKMPVIRILVIHPIQSSVRSIRAGMVQYPFQKGTTFEYDVLTIPTEMRRERSSRIVVTQSDSMEGVVYVPKGIESALRKLHSTSSRRSIWIKSACLNHDDAFEADYYKGTYLLSVYERASNVYIWCDGIGKEATSAMDWIAAAAQEIQTRENETWHPESKLRLALDSRKDRALAAFFSCSALVDVETSGLVLAALDKYVPTYFLGERGQVSAEDAYMVCGYFCVVKPDELSGSLSSVIARIKTVVEQARMLVCEMPDTVPTEVVYRTEAARQDSLDRKRSKKIYTKRYESDVGAGQSTSFSGTTSFQGGAADTTSWS